MPALHDMRRTKDREVLGDVTGGLAERTGKPSDRLLPVAIEHIHQPHPHRRPENP
jgi:hypothetical protein